MVLLTAVLFCALINLWGGFQGLTPNLASGYQQRLPTMAFWNFVGAFISGFGVGWPSRMDRKEKYGCLVLLLSGVVTSAMIGILGSCILIGAGLYDPSPEGRYISLGTGLFFGGIIWVWLSSRFSSAPSCS
jgi:hypothetical protein